MEGEKAILVPCMAWLIDNADFKASLISLRQRFAFISCQSTIFTKLNALPTTLITDIKNMKPIKAPSNDIDVLIVANEE